MTDGFGNLKYVYNPLTYDELRSALEGKIDPYLECMSKRGQLNAAADSEENEEQLLSDDERCEDLKPAVPALDSQQIGAIAVLERCKSNYQQKQWDAGAFLLYNNELASQLISSGTSVSLPVMDSSDAVGACLVRAEKNREPNDACLTDYLSLNYYKESTSAVYWRYEKVASPISTTDNTDACIVFSGPAKRTDNSSTTLEFRKCSHDYTESGCVIPHIVWSSNSNNKIPVAVLHTVEEVDAEDREEVARAMFAEAHTMAMTALTKLENFTDKNLEVVLFSGEDDVLHQIFDCIVMGPMARVDFWDRGVSKELEVGILFVPCLHALPLCL